MNIRYPIYEGVYRILTLRKEAAFVLNIMYFIVLSVIKYDVSCKDNCFFVCLSTFLYDVKCF